MADRVTSAQRSENMRRIRSKDTAPELIVRRAVYALGFRYRLHAKELPGKPDIVFRSRRKAIFVHGCYWHGHGCARGGRGAKSNQAYWGPKIAKNRARDDAAIASLKSEGWRILVVWECGARDGTRLKATLARFLDA